MNKKLPFEEALEQQMNNLPSPNEDESWQKMKKLLDENGKPVPLSFLKTYKVWIVLILLLLMGVWFIILPAHAPKEKPVTTSENNAALQQKRLTPHSKKAQNKIQNLKPTIPDALPTTVNIQGNHSAQSASIASTAKTMSHQETKTTTGMESRTPPSKIIFKQNKSKQNNLSSNKQISIKETSLAGIKRDVVTTKDNSTNSSKTLPGLQKNNTSVDTTSIIPDVEQDTSIAKQKDSLSHKEDVAANKNTASKKTALHGLKKYFVSAGIGVQQQIPVSGQQVVRYGYNGNNALSDYIPSIYFGFEREQKWFLQGEFIYGAPQLLKEFAYSRQTQADTSGTVTSTTLRLKKTFYNQIPVSFNYYLRPNLSAGIGMTYSWLHGAIAEKEISIHTPLTPTNTVVQQVVPIAGFTDSFLYRSHTYLMLQADYQWRKFSMGLRYTRDVQPYIKYTLPDGAVADQKNWSLQFILGFRLGKSRRF